MEWALKPFERKMRLFQIIKTWLLFAVLGLVVMGAIQYFAKYDLSEADTLKSETGVGCDQLAMVLLLALPPIEELVFRIAPRRYFGNKAALIGSMVWALLHLFGRNLAIVGFQVIMGVFYYKLVISGRYKETILLHEAFNLVPLLTCFLF